MINFIKQDEDLYYKDLLRYRQSTIRKLINWYFPIRRCYPLLWNRLL